VTSRGKFWLALVVLTGVQSWDDNLWLKVPIQVKLAWQLSNLVTTVRGKEGGLSAS